MSNTRYKPEQIATMLRQIEVGVANGKTTPQACKEAGITVQTYYRWRNLEKENVRRRRVAELSLEKQVLKDVAEKNC